MFGAKDQAYVGERIVQHQVLNELAVDLVNEAKVDVEALIEGTLGTRQGDPRRDSQGADRRRHPKAGGGRRMKVLGIAPSSTDFKWALLELAAGLDPAFRRSRPRRRSCPPTPVRGTRC